MRSFLLPFFIFLVMLTSASAQVFDSPFISTVGDRLCYINKVELTDRYTIVSLEHLNNNNGWIRLDTGVHINAHGKRYRYLRSENIALVPNQYPFEPGEKRHAFKIYFEPLPKDIRVFDLLEVEPGTRYDFNFYGIDLDRKRQSDVQISQFVRDAAPGEKQKIQTEVISVPAPFTNYGDFYKGLTKSLMGEYINYFKQPQTLKELAQINKIYFNSLLNEGFTRAEALKMVLALPVNSFSKANQ